jgi:AraC-like DNA-binding protein
MSRLDRISDWLERAKIAEYDIRKLADLCQVSPSQLWRYWKARFRKTPRQWLLELQLWQAARWLCTSEDSVKYISAELHFNSECRLCRLFKRYFGCTTSQYVIRNKLFYGSVTWQ